METTMTVRAHGLAISFTEGLLRVSLAAIGFMLVATGALFAASIVLLPLGAFAMLAGVGVVAWALTADLSVASVDERGDTRSNALHTPWDCRWSKVDWSRSRFGVAATSEIPWLCARLTPWRPVTEDECAHCSEWEPRGRRGGRKQAA